MRIRQLIPAAPGFRAAYVLDDDPRDIGLVPVVAWAVPDVEVTYGIAYGSGMKERQEVDPGLRAFALVLDGEEGQLVPASKVNIPGLGRFVSVIGPEDQERDVRAQVEQEHDANNRDEERKESEEDARELAKLGFDVTPDVARIARDFLGGIPIRSGADPSKPGKMNDVDREKLAAILHAALLRFGKKDDGR